MDFDVDTYIMLTANEAKQTLINISRTCSHTFSNFL